MLKHIILCILILCILIMCIFTYKRFTNYPCSQELTDDEYIHHMIMHHEVAVYMSEHHLHNTKNPIILDILRNLIRLQKYEINLMKDSKIVNFTAPNTPYLSNTFCDPGFFKMTHTNMPMTDEMYIQHMIPHHQVAVDMSKKILNTTHNDFIIDLAYTIIRNQQLEISTLYSLSTSKNMFESNIL